MEEDPFLDRIGVILEAEFVRERPLLNQLIDSINIDMVRHFTEVQLSPRLVLDAAAIRLGVGRPRRAGGRRSPVDFLRYYCFRGGISIR
jgi:hypothetical protein